MPTFTLRVNGRQHHISADAGDNLLTIVRDDLGLTGSKYGCGEGQCGACTVLIDGTATRSCITRVGTLAGKNITTIEGLATGTRLHPVQEAFLETEAFQCGYCTSGMIMAVVALLRTHPDPGEDEIARLMDRSVCRCGVYPRIVQAVRTAATRLRETSSAAGKNGGQR